MVWDLGQSQGLWSQNLLDDQSNNNTFLYHIIIMKIDTKKCAPVSPTTPNVLVNPNKNIIGRDQQLVLPSSPSIKKEETTDNGHSKEEEEVGRTLMYLPNLVFSPVLRTTRTTKDEPPTVVGKKAPVKKDVAAVTKDVAMDLTKLFESALKISDDASTATESESDSDEEKPTTPPLDKEKKAPLGRVDTTVFSYRDCKSHSVRRSARNSAKQY
eukprot:scaffold2794_cov100-Cylindrotheca_fusiformis.AAC.8